MARLRKFIAIVGVLFVLGMAPVYTWAEATADAEPTIGLWEAAYGWVTGWFTAWTADGEPTDPEGTLPLEPVGPGGGENTTTSGDPDGGENGAGMDPDG